MPNDDGTGGCYSSPVGCTEMEDREKKDEKLSTEEVVELAWEARWKHQREGQPLRRIARRRPPDFSSSPTNH